VKARKIVICISPSAHHSAFDGPSKGAGFSLPAWRGAYIAQNESFTAPGTDPLGGP